jgi:GNAT superfamily N-acetyltransferase
MNVVLKRDLVDIDWKQLSEVYRRCFGFDVVLHEIQKEFRGADLVCIAVVDDRIVGAAHAFTDHIRDAAIYGLVVHPDFQRCGIATQIMNELLKDLPNVAVLLNSSPEAEPLYRKLGFRHLKHAMGLRFPEEEYRDEQ